jgi:3'-phosphoadenosine 5'-phosphosulfate sulfotransferase (PAPS reductase)/FAD synthetase
MNHVVFFSGGIGSFFTAKRVIEKYGKENVHLLFTDTLIEDQDLYRFMDDAEKYFGIEIAKIADGRTPFEVFKDTRFLGNSRLAKCSHILKQDTAKKWIKENFKPEDTVLYLGIDWTEEHRTAAPTRNWSPYKVEFPMCEEPYVTKDEMLDYLKEVNIKIPRLYKLGFSHNNCGGMCVRAGQGHFANLLEKLPDNYKRIEEHEQEMREYLGKDVSILTRTRNGIKKQLTLTELRKEYEQYGVTQIDMFDLGGCGCFVTEDE